MIESSNLTKDRIKQYLAEGKRFDNRKVDEFRDIKVECCLSKKAEGSAKVKIGKTEVWVGVKLDVGEPYPDSPDKGNMMVTCELLPLSHGKYEYGPPKFEAIELGRLVDRCIRESGYIDFEKLCIKAGEKVWTIFIDVYSINDDGNLLDAAVIGALASLREAKVPAYNEETGKIDYKKEEEEASQGRLILAAIPTSPIKICSMQKGETMQISPEKFEEMLEFAEKKHKTFLPELNKLIDNAIKHKEKK